MTKLIIKTIFLIITLIIIAFIFLFYNPQYITKIADRFFQTEVVVNNIKLDSNNGLSIILYDITYANDDLNTKIDSIKLSMNNKKLDLMIDKMSLSINKIHASKFHLFTSVPALSIVIKKLNLTYKNLKLSTSLNIINKDHLMIKGLIAKFDIATNLDKVKIIKNPKIREYLQQSIKYGGLQDIAFEVDYNKLNGNFEFLAKGKINNGKIKFNPQWSAVQDIYSDFIVNKDRLILNIISAKSGGILIKNSQVIVDWNKEKVQVLLEKVNSSAKEVLVFLQNSPISQNIKNTLDYINLDGDAGNITINLTIPFVDAKNNSKVDISGYLSNNLFSAFNNKFIITNIVARVQYKNNKLSVNGSGDIFGKNSIIQLNIAKKTLISIKNENNFDITYDNNKWDVVVSGKNINGNIVADFNHKTPLLTLKNLNIKTTQDSKIDFVINPIYLSSFNLIIDNLIIDKYLVPDLQAKIKAKDKGLFIDNLTLKNIKTNNYNITFYGSWTDGKTSLYTTITGNNVKELLNILNIKKETEGGKFDFYVELFCNCSPWQLRLNTATGTAKMNVKNGVLTENDAKIGRIFSLLNINSITDRLSLNLKDVASKGFSYDDIDAKVVLIKNGILKIDNFIINSTSSKITIEGESNLKTKTYDLTANVAPAIKDSIPIMAYLAGGGVGGLGAWLLDKIIFKDKLLNKLTDDIATFNYKITGSWEKPIIK